MARKLALDLESLAVDSFATDGAEGGRGTVAANDGGEAPGACTCRDSCRCHTAYYVCGTGPESYSCDYTLNRSCAAE